MIKSIISEVITLIKSINQNSMRPNDDFISGFLDGVDFKINSFGVYKQEDIADLEQFYTSDYELVYYLTGNANIDTYGKSINTSSGHVALLKPFNLYSAHCNEDIKLSYYFIHFDIIPDALHQTFFDIVGTNLIHLSDSDIPELSFLFSEILQTWQNKESGLRALSIAVLRIFFVYILRNITITTDIDPLTYDGDIKTMFIATKYIQNNIKKPIRVEMVAKELGISTSGLYKIFMSTLNQSPSHYIKKTKLLESKKLLAFTGKTIDQIADSLGFLSSSHFCRDFHKEYGLPPSKYRKDIVNIVKF